MSEIVPFDPEPESEEGYAAAREHLRRRFSAWAETNESGLGPDAIEELLHYKWGYLDRHLTRWHRADLDEVLLELVPAKVILGDDEIDEIVPAAVAFITFLEESGLLDDESEDPALLREHLVRLEPRLRVHLADPARYSRGKRFWLQAKAAGVSPDDEEGVAAFVEQFNARSRTERDSILGRAPRPGTGRFTPPGTPPRPKSPGRKRKGRK